MSEERKECVVCAETVEGEGDWNEFNACRECWVNKRDEVMAKRFPLMQVFSGEGGQS